MTCSHDDADDRDAPQATDLEEDGCDDTVDCPACGQTIHEDAPRCPYCGQWVFDDTPAARRSRGWFWPLMIALLIAVILVIWHRLGW